MEECDKLFIECTDDCNDGAWISVKDRLPEKAGFYIGYIPQTDVFFVYWQGDRWDVRGVTHWQPSPEPPKVNCPIGRLVKRRQYE